MTSPETSGSIGPRAQNQVEIRACLQITRNARNLREVVKDTGWCSRGIIKESLRNKLGPSETNIRGKNHSLWVPGIDREIRNSGTELFEGGRKVSDLPSLK